ncbi:MAG: hypothetical protein KIT14_07575 [bacterium]|nr:hypothetical protein [bacterium]
MHDSVSPTTPSRALDDLLATPDGVVAGLRRVEHRIAELAHDGQLLAELFGVVADRLLALVAHANEATHAGDPDAPEIRRLVATSAANARALAFNAMHTLRRTATILSLQPADIAAPQASASTNH